MFPRIFISYSGAFIVPLYSFYREVETLTQEDRDIMDGSTFFFFCYTDESPVQKLRPTRIRVRNT